jgi:hypothetical protein
MVATLSTGQTAGSAGSANATSSLSGILAKVAGGSCKSALTVPFQVKGTTADPKFVPDVGGLAADMFKSKLGCVGGSNTAAGANAQANPNPVDAITGLFKKKKP